MGKFKPDDYRGILAVTLGVSLMLVIIFIGAVAITDSFTGNDMRPEDLQMTVTLVVALLGTIGTYLGVETVLKNKNSSKSDGDSGPDNLE
jgi:hypothetical protein